MQIHSKLPRVGTTIFAVMSQLAGEHGAINLGQGFPDFAVPEFLIDAMARAAREGKSQYAPMTGIPTLRQAIAEKTARCYGVAVDPEREITVTSGASEAIYAAIQAVVRAGEEVIVLDPCYDCYEPAIDLAGASAVHIPLRPDDFSVDWQRVRDAVTPRTRMIMVNSPHNPSGAAFATADLDALADIVRDTDIVVLSDEVYEHIIFDGREHATVLRHAELAPRSFVISSFGKTYHCTGWKVGYCIAPAALSVEFRKVHQYITFCTFHPAQAAFAEMIRAHPEHDQALPAFYQAKRDRFQALLKPSRLGLRPVAGSYFQLVDYAAISELDDVAFCRWLVAEKRIAAIPLSPFYRQHPGTRVVRLCFAKSDETLAAAAQVLCTI